MVWLGTRRENQLLHELKTLFIWPLTESLSFKTSKFEMTPMVKVVSLETMNNFCIGRF
jgi:hypothetical protein